MWIARSPRLSRGRGLKRKNQGDIGILGLIGTALVFWMGFIFLLDFGLYPSLWMTGYGPFFYLLGFLISHKALVMGLVRIFYGLLLFFW
jgi:hypothetical protein